MKSPTRKTGTGGREVGRRFNIFNKVSELREEVLKARRRAGEKKGKRICRREKKMKKTTTTPH